MSAALPLYSRTSFCQLPTGVSTLSVAEEARAAALSFVNGIAHGWGKRELCEWLAGPYKQVTRYATPARGAEPQGVVYRDTSKNVPMLDDATLSTMLRDARWSVLGALEASKSRSRATYVGSTLAHHLAVPCIDERGGHGWVPVDAHAARLHQRVLALFAVDQLRNPELHGCALMVCPFCEKVVFDVDARTRGMCDEHDREREFEPVHAPAAAYAGRPASATRPYVVPAPERRNTPAPASSVPVAKRTLIGVGHLPGQRQA